MYFIDFPQNLNFFCGRFSGFDLGFTRRLGYDEIVKLFNKFWDKK